MSQKRKLAKNRHIPTSTGAEQANSETDWLTALVKQTTSNDPDAGSTYLKLNQQERIEKRQAKKQRRRERQVEKSIRRNHSQEKRDGAMANTSATANTTATGSQKRTQSQSSSNEWNKQFLSKLASEIESLVEAHPIPKARHLIRLYPGETAKLFRKRNWDLSNIQPRRNDYGGIGLARDSLFLDTEDPSFLAKLDQEFQEHIPGFFGKQRTKAMKKQLNSNMLWKQMAAKKDMKINGKRLRDMTPDEQVEALIKAGMV